jgi:SPX domain
LDEFTQTARNKVRKALCQQHHPRVANEISRSILCFPSYADREQYKKAKKLIKEVEKAEWRKRLSSVSTQRSRGRTPVNGENRRAIPRPSSYSQNKKPTLGSEGVPFVDVIRRHMDSSSVVSRPIIVLPEHKGNKSPVVDKRSQVHLSPVVYNVRKPGIKLTADSIELVNLEKDHNNEFDEGKLNFLQWLDKEIKKIDDFYCEKENAAAERYKVICAQFEALLQLGESHLMTNEDNKLPPYTSNPELSTYSDRPDFRSRWRTLISKLRVSLDRLHSAMPAADHASRVKHPDLIANPMTTTTGCVEYRVARRRLKYAILEFYRGMELLKGYQLLNQTGLDKILKKFDKRSRHKISGEYAEKLKSVHFYQSDKLGNLMHKTEV